MSASPKTETDAFIDCYLNAALEREAQDSAPKKEEPILNTRYPELVAESVQYLVPDSSPESAQDLLMRVSIMQTSEVHALLTRIDGRLGDLNENLNKHRTPPPSYQDDTFNAEVPRTDVVDTDEKAKKTVAELDEEKSAQPDSHKSKLANKEAILASIFIALCAIGCIACMIFAVTKLVGVL